MSRSRFQDYLPGTGSLDSADVPDDLIFAFLVCSTSVANQLDVIELLRGSGRSGASFGDAESVLFGVALKCIDSALVRVKYHRIVIVRVRIDVAGRFRARRTVFGHDEVGGWIGFSVFCKFLEGKQDPWQRFRVRVT